MRKDHLSNDVGATGFPHVKKKSKFRVYTTHNSKWVINLNVKPNMINFLGENLCDLRLGKGFLDNTPKT